MVFELPFKLYPSTQKNPATGIDDGAAAVAKLIESKVNIIVLLAFAPTGRHVLCAALRAGPDLLFGRQHAWVLMGHNPGGWWKRDTTDTHDCSDNELRQAVQGYLAVDRDASASTHLIDPTGVHPTVWRESYRTKSGAAGVSWAGPVAYDVRGGGMN